MILLRWIRKFCEGFLSLLSGMLLTFRYMLQKPVTVLYPQKTVASDSFKGPISFSVDPHDGSHKCIACNACIKVCPSRCMHLEVAKNAEGQRVLSDFKVDHSLCSLCTLCIEACPTDALVNDSTHYAEVALSREAMIHDLLDPFRRRGINVDTPIRTPAQRKAEREKAVQQPNGTHAAPEAGGAA